VSKSKLIVKRFNPALLILLILIASCTAPGIVPDYYQTTSISTKHSTGPVAELHRNAISALNQGRYAQSVEYLQRAIKIDPRNAFSWHYLAQTYWHSQQYGRCLDMIKRSASYSSELDDLDRANAALKLQCEVT